MTEQWLRETADGVEIQVLVVPRASVSELAGIQEGRLRVRLTAPPVEGKANQELIRFLAKELGLARASLELVTGMAGRRKTVRAWGATRDIVLEKVKKVLGDPV